MSSEKTSVQVAVRIRPITSQDLVTIPAKFQKSVLSTAPYAPNQVIVSGEKKQYFSYDYVFGPEMDQRDVYDKSVLKLIDKFLEGYNVTILAYGQTSSGKTFTMGTSDHESIEPDFKGIIPRAVSTLFSSMNSAQYKARNFSIKVSFVEIYYEDLIDLLGEGEGDSRPQVLIREDTKGNILWSGLQEIKVNSVEEVIALLARGSLNRQTGATDMNAQSSRSHAIFSITLAQQKFVPSPGSSPSSQSSPSPQPNDSQQNSGVRPPSRSLSRIFDEGEWVSITSKCHFVDLAGSERLKHTSTIGDRAREGISINSGLLALGNVISSLGDPNKAKHTTHIPYRDSKLTRLLQDSLGGNAQTLMIACVTSAEYNLSETVNTLKYANRARNIKNSAIINAEEAGWNDLDHLQNLVIKLRNEIKAVKAAGAIVTSDDSSTNGTTPDGTTSISGGEQQNTTQNNKDVEALEEQLQLLQSSYSKLSQRYAKTSAELAKHQDNDDNLSSLNDTLVAVGRNSLSKVDDKKHAKFKDNVDHDIEGYGKSFSSLESQLTITKAALTHSESTIQEQQVKLDSAEKSDEQNKVRINELKNKIAKFTERESTTERYIKDLENELERLTLEQEKDQDLINELRSEIANMKTNRSNTEGYIQDLENKLSISDKQSTKLIETIEKLENRLRQHEAAYHKLEERLRRAEADEDKELLLNELVNREERISLLEQKIESLVNEIEELRNLKEHDEHDILFSHPRDDTTDDDQILVANLESRFSELYKIHEKAIKEFEDIKLTYQSEIQELQNQLIEARSIQSETIKSTPVTPMSPQSPASGNSFRFSSISLNETNKILNDNNSVTLKHKKPQSFFTELDKSDKDDDALVIQKLHNELHQLSSLHEDKTQGLDAVKQEFARLEMSYRETLDIVEELREEIKRRDALAQLEVMSVISESAGSYCSDTSEIDELEIVQRLREEVEQLKKEQKISMEALSKYEKGTLIKHDGILRIESNIQELREELCCALEKQKDERVIELQSRIQELEQELINIQRQEQIAEDNSGKNADSSKEIKESESSMLRRQVKKLQNDIESKSHTIAALLLPSDEYQNTIRQLEDKLQEVREAQRQAIKDKHDKLITISETIKDENNSQFVNTNYPEKAFEEQNVDKTVKALDEEAEANPTQKDISKEKEIRNKHLSDIENHTEKEHLEHVSKLTKMLETKDIEKKEAIVALENKVSELQSQLKNAKESDEKHAQLVKELEAKLKESNALLLEKEQSLSDKKYVEMKAIIEKTRAELESSKPQLQESDDYISKLAKANEEIETLKEKCISLHYEINGIHNDALLQSSSNIDENVVEDLSKELKKVQEEAHAQQEHVNTLQKKAGELQLEKDNQLLKNAELAQQVELLQKDLDKFSKTQGVNEVQMKKRLSELETQSSNPYFAKLAAANESLRQTNYDLNNKIGEAEKHALSLNKRIGILESELECTKSANNSSSLEGEKRELEQASKSFLKEHQKLDQRIESSSLIRTSGHGENKTATHLAELNAKILSLEKEVNEQLEQESSDLSSIIGAAKDSESSLDSRYVSQALSTSHSLKSSIQVKLFQQESTITQQNSTIKTLQDKVNKFERQLKENSYYDTQIGSYVDLDAVGGYHAVSPTKDLRRIASPASPPPSSPPPPTPPPNQPLPQVPLKSPTSPGAPPKILRSGSLDSSNKTISDLTVEKLHKQITKLEGDNLQNRQFINTLETSLKDSEINLRVAKKQLQVLQIERFDLIDQTKSLKTQLEDVAEKFEHTKILVQKEKKAIESVLLQERKAKEAAERSTQQLENRMEELIAKRSKFMCF